MNTISHLCGWRESTFEDYKRAYNAFGGSVLSDPRILKFIHSRFNLNERFFTKRDHHAELVAGICVWDNHYIAGDQQIVKKYGVDQYPLNFDEIVLPISPAVRTVLPYRTKFLSEINHLAVRNSNHRFNAHREISIVRPVSSKTNSSRNRELRKFIDAGGSIHNVTEYAPEDLIGIYADLFYLRRSKSIEIEKTHELLLEIPGLMFGNVLAFKGEPCALQWVVKSEDHQRVYLDYVNAGMNTTLPQHLSVGTLAAWINVRAAMKYGEDSKKQIRFSFGRPTADYKERWCNREPLYRVIA